MIFEKESLKSSLSDQDIEDTEEVLGNISSDLINLYRQQNGGMPSRGVFIADNGNEYLLDYLFPIPEVRLESARQNIVKINLALKQQHLIPDDNLAFG